VVALHHSGVPKRNDKGEVLTSDGRPWQEWMGEQRIAWVANEGVRVSQLVRHIQAQALAPEAEELRAELLEAAPPPLEPPRQQPLPTGEGLPREEPTSPTPQAGAGGTATFTIPLQVSLSFGAPVELKAQAVQETQGTQEGLLFGRRPPSPPPPPPAPPVSAADFRLASLANTTFDWETALSLGLASQLAYSPAEQVKAQALAWGFSDCVFVEEGAAQGFVAWAAQGTLVAFRGTESTADWVSNLHLTTRSIPKVGQVHAGFWGQFQALQPQMEKLLNGRAASPLVVTGHSLGGGIAVLAATTWASTRTLRALYTYGQPAVAKDNAAAAIGASLSGRYHRMVNAADIVPRVPPGYRHAGHLLHFDGQGRVTSTDPAPPAGRPGLAGGKEAAGEPDPTMLSAEDFKALQRQLKGGATLTAAEGTTSLISDHMLPGYLSKIRQQIS